MRYQILLIGLGGAIGSVCRYLLQLFVYKNWAVVFPVGTFFVNITGCLLIGIIYGLAIKNFGISEEWRLFLITGICGGFTTFSSFTYESIVLFRNGNYLYFFMYVILSVVIGLLATFTGMIITK